MELAAGLHALADCRLVHGICGARLGHHVCAQTASSQLDSPSRLLPTRSPCEPQPLAPPSPPPYSRHCMQKAKAMACFMTGAGAVYQ